MSTEAIVVVVVLVVLIVAFILIRNAIIGSRNLVQEAWSGIDVQLKRRHDLVPNLVSTVEGYAGHERDVLEKTTAARSEAARAGSVEETRAAEERLSGALVALRAVAENYPQLRATENFQRLQGDLSEIEDEIQAARRTYNSNVQRYNTRIQIFPNSLVARASGFRPRDFFEIETASERDPSRVSFA